MHRTILLSLLSCTAAVSLSGCATIVEGSTDKINVVTAPPSNAACTLTNSRGTYNTFASGLAVVKRSTSDLNVVCADQSSGARGQSTVASDVEGWAFGNILLGGIIGLGVDWGTGAAYTYPNSTTVSLIAPVAAVTPAPLEYQGTSPINSIASAYAAPTVNTQPSTSSNIQGITPAIVPAYAAPVVNPQPYTPTNGQIVAPSVAPAPNFNVPSGN